MERKEYPMFIVVFTILLGLTAVGLLSEAMPEQLSGLVDAKQTSAAKPDQQIVSDTGDQLGGIEKRVANLEKSHGVIAMAKDLAIPGVAVLISGVALFYSLRDKLRQAEVNGKLISWYDCFNARKKRIYYLIRMGVFSRYKDFSPKDIDGYIKYRDREELICKMFPATRLFFNLPDFITGQERLKETDPVVAQNYLTSYAVLPKDMAVDGYIPFYARYEEDGSIEHIRCIYGDDNIEYVRLIFRDHTGRESELVIEREDIVDQEKLFNDENIWRDADISRIPPSSVQDIPRELF